MAKKRDVQQFDGPEILDMDSISTLSDDELVARFQKLDAGRAATYETPRASPRDWEVEIAYIRREQQLRRARREAHDAYLSGHRDEGFVDVLSDEFDDSVVNNDLPNRA